MRAGNRERTPSVHLNVILGWLEHGWEVTLKAGTLCDTVLELADMRITVTDFAILSRTPREEDGPINIRFDLTMALDTVLRVVGLDKRKPGSGVLLGRHPRLGPFERYMHGIVACRTRFFERRDTEQRGYCRYELRPVW